MPSPEGFFQHILHDIRDACGRPEGPCSRRRAVGLSGSWKFPLTTCMVAHAARHSRGESTSFYPVHLHWMAPSPVCGTDIPGPSAPLPTHLPSSASCPCCRDSKPDRGPREVVRGWLWGCSQGCSHWGYKKNWHNLGCTLGSRLTGLLARSHPNW